MLAALRSCISHHAMSDTLAKRPRFTDKLKKTNYVKRMLPHMSNAAFAKVVKFASENDMTEVAHSRLHIRSARDSSLEDTPYGRIMTKVDLIGTPPYANRKMNIQNPFAYLYLACRNGGWFLVGAQRRFSVLSIV